MLEMEDAILNSQVVHQVKCRSDLCLPRLFCELRTDHKCSERAHWDRLWYPFCHEGWAPRR